MLLLVIAPATALGTPAPQQAGNFTVSVAGTADGSVPHQIDLKMTQLPGGQISKVTGFIVGPEDVVQVNQGENLLVATSPDLRTQNVTLKSTRSTNKPNASTWWHVVIARFDTREAYVRCNC